MNTTSFNEQSTSTGYAVDASLGTLPSTLHDKENLPDLSTNRLRLQGLGSSNRHSLPGYLDTYADKLPLNARDKSASGSKGPCPAKGRRTDGGAVSDLHLSPRKRTSSMAEMDDSPLPLKRPRPDVPFNFIKDLEQLDEDLEIGRLIFLDIIDAQDKREIYIHKPEDIPIIVSSIDPRELFENGSTSRAGTHGSEREKITGRSAESDARERSVISLLRDDCLFGCFVDGLWSGKDKQDEKKEADQSSQEGGDRTTTYESDLQQEENRVDAVEAPTDCETNEPLPSPGPLPIMEGASLSEVDVNADPTLIPGGSTVEPRTSPSPPRVVQTPLAAVPEVVQLPKATMTNPSGERESGAHSNGIVGTGVAGPSNPTYTPFAYTQAQAQEIWELTCDKNYLGAHALFDEREQVIVVSGQEKVRRYLNAHPDMKARVKDTNNSRPRDSLYVCGASAIWRKVEKSQNSTAGETPEFELTYKPCHGCAYATIDNYKKHIYRHHLGKVYKQYSWKGKRRA